MLYEKTSFEIERDLEFMPSTMSIANSAKTVVATGASSGLVRHAPATSRCPTSADHQTSGVRGCQTAFIPK